MVEIRQSLSSAAEWKQFRDSLTGIAAINSEIVEDARRDGYEEPLTGLRRRSDEISIDPIHLHESISSHELNARKRALILQFWNEICARNWQRRRDLRILSADGVTRLALILRGLYPFFYGGEYLPSEVARKAHFPIPHLDLHHIDLPDDSFDVFISGDVFEHLPHLALLWHFFEGVPVLVFLNRVLRDSWVVGIRRAGHGRDLEIRSGNVARAVCERFAA